MRTETLVGSNQRQRAELSQKWTQEIAMVNWEFRGLYRAATTVPYASREKNWDKSALSHRANPQRSGET